MRQRRKDTLQGTLDLLVMRTLRDSDALHGFAISQRVHEVSEEALRVEEGSLYPALHRMEEAGWVKSTWKVSDNNRRARYYVLTARGRLHLSALEESWSTHVRAVTRVLRHA